MKTQEYSITSSTEKDKHWIEDKIDDFNRKQLSFTGKTLETPLNFVIKDGSTLIGGITSCFYFEEALSIGVLFVDEKYRHKGIGTLLLNKVEKEAKAKGAKLAHLYTFDFQAKDFYLEHGYETFAILENCPKAGHKCFYLKKNL